MRPEEKPYKLPRWLKPGVALMQRFDMSIKLACIAILLILPLSVVTFIQVSEQIQTYRLVKLENLGVQAVSLLIDVVTEVQQHRTHVLLSGDAALENERGQNRQRLGAALAAVDNWNKAHPELDLAKPWAEIRSDIQALPHELTGKDSAPVIAQHTKETLHNPLEIMLTKSSLAIKYIA